MKTGVVNLPLHYGKAPRWLFSRMRNLARQISIIIVEEQGKKEFLRRLSEPYWFQALGCVLGFDWHSSGLTTTTTAALKEAIPPELGIAVSGGKGKTSRKTPLEITKKAQEMNLSDEKIREMIRASRLAAKIDNSVIQDGFSLYHHTFFFYKQGWSIIQQGMAEKENYARRYHWLSDNIKSFVEEPHTAICSDLVREKALNMTSKETKEARKMSVDIIKDNPIHIKRYLDNLDLSKIKAKQNGKGQKTLIEFSKNNLTLSTRHFPKIEANFRIMMKAYEMQPGNYEELLLIRGIGPKTIRALALISELIYGTPLDWKDPVKFSFAHGGKDGFPYPVNQEQYDKSIEVLNSAVKNAKVGNKTKIKALKRLNSFMKSSLSARKEGADSIKKEKEKIEVSQIA